jgi:hypothetical protein
METFEKSNPYHSSFISHNQILDINLTASLFLDK